jgi:hypothetical protein
MTEEERELLELAAMQTGPTVDLSDINTWFSEQNAPTAEQITKNLQDFRGQPFDLASWLAADPARTPQQAYEQGLIRVGTANPTESFGTGLGEMGPIAGGFRTDYSQQLDDLLSASGRSRVEERDGDLYALFTGQDDRFKAISALPVGYEWAEGDRTPGEYYRVQIPEPDFGEKYLEPLLKNSIAIGAALTGNPWAAGLASGASTGFKGGDLKDVLTSAALAAAPIAISDFLTPATSVVGADGLSNVVTNTASGAARGAAPNLARETSGFLSNLSAGAQSATANIANTLSQFSSLPITPDDVAAALTSGTMTGLRGGDLEDVLKSAAAAGLTSPVTKAIGAQLGIDTEGEIEVPNLFREGTTGINKDDLFAALGAGVGAVAGGGGLDEVAQDALLKYIREGGSLGFLKPGEFNLPDFNLPEFDLPDFNLPDFNLPDFNLPDFNLPDFNLPEFDLPDFNLPEFDLPDFNLPEFNLPEFNLPEFNLPEFNLPEFNLPEFNLPDVDLPDLPSLPDVDLPDVNLPDLPDIDFPSLGLSTGRSYGLRYNEAGDQLEPMDITPMDLAGALDFFMSVSGNPDYNMDDIMNLLDNRSR